jgi:YHS domain-containing protein
MNIEETEAAATAEYAEDLYYFCSEECQQKFIADPEKFVSRTDAGQS